jgi:hypothetical protein
VLKDFPRRLPKKIRREITDDWGRVIKMFKDALRLIEDINKTPPSEETRYHFGVTFKTPIARAANDLFLFRVFTRRP